MKKIIIIVSVLFVFTPTVFADVYKYVDKDGVICYTDSPFGKKAERIIKEKRTPSSRIVKDTRYGSHIQKAASKYAVSPELIDAVIQTESNGNPRAVSKKGAMGLMQLMPTTAQDMNVSNPFSIGENIEGGTKYLKYLLEKFNGDLTLALAAYNAGPKAVEKYGAVPPYAETRKYVDKVFTLYRGTRFSYDGQDVNYSSVTPSKIHKIVLEDGTILFTNTSFAKTVNVRF